MGTEVRVTACLLMACEIIWATLYLIPWLLKKLHHMMEPLPLKNISGKKVLMLREYLPEMLKRNEGQVVAIASAGGLIAPANMSLYSATKYAVVGLMESLTEELRLNGSDVKLTCVCPNFVRTLKAFDTSLKARIPPMDLSEAVQGIMKGIREEKSIFTVPRFFMHLVSIMRIFPTEIQNKLRDVMYVRLEESVRN